MTFTLEAEALLWSQFCESSWLLQKVADACISVEMDITTLSPSKDTDTSCYDATVRSADSVAIHKLKKLLQL